MMPDLKVNHTNVTISMDELRATEATVWILCFLLVSFIGIFARYLDDLEEKKQGKLQLQYTNLFCATFTSSMAVFYSSITIVQAGAGSLSGFTDLLLGKALLSPLQEFQACIVNALMFGYMVQDLAGRFAFGNYKWPYIVHHLACIVGLTQCLWYDQTAMFTSAVGISESTTPLVAIIEIGRTEGLKKLVLVCGMLLNVVFPFRVAFFTWITYLWAFHHIHAPFGAGADLEFWHYMINLSGLIAVAVLAMLNWLWWYEIVSATISTLCTKRPKSKAA